MRVIHVDKDAIAELTGPAGGLALLIYWCGDQPVGQAELPFDGEGRLPAGDVAASCPVAGPPSQPARQAVPQSSIVICTRDRPDDLERCLASLGSQSRQPNEVIVVDNASRDDRTRMVAAAAGVTYIREDRPGLDFARNAGARVARHAIVAYTDDDVVLHPSWLERLVDAFDDADVMAVTGLVLPAELETEAQQIFERHWGFGRGYQRIDFGPDFFKRTRATGCPAWEVGAGASMAFRREAFERVGYFDERLDAGAAGCSGDSEFWYRLLAAGWRCRYEPTAVAYHYHRRTIEALARQIRAYMRGHVTALFIQHERTRERGNLRRIWRVMPRYYAARIYRRLRDGRGPHNRFLMEEIQGALGGIVYYYRALRPPPH